MTTRPWRVAGRVPFVDGIARLGCGRVSIGVAALWMALGSVASPASADTVSGGVLHSVIRTPDGHVWAFGGNGNGQLGDGTTTAKTVPIEVPSLTNVVAVAAGGYHTLFLKADGTVWAVGRNTEGQLGDGSNTQRTSPVQVQSLTSVTAIAAGDYHSVALTSTGAVWTWGKNTTGQLGIGSTTNYNAPQVVSSLTASAIGAGADHTLAVTSAGAAWAWGKNSYGQLGDGSTTQRTAPVQMSGVTTAAAAAGGGNHSVILLTTGALKATGWNTSGQLGDGTTTQRTSPVAVSTLTTVVAVRAGSTHTAALTSDGSVWGWGWNASGQVGDGTTSNRNTPTQTALSGIALIGAGRTHGVAVSSTEVVSTWGDNGSGQLGTGTTIDRPTPGAISGPSYTWKVGTPVLSPAGGSFTTTKTVTVTEATPGATTTYTIDGAEPTINDPGVASGGTVNVTESLTLKGRAFKTGMPSSDVASATFTLSVATVQFSLASGTYTTPQSLTLTTTSPGVTIRYTTDGSTPTEGSVAYTGALSVATSMVVKAIGFRAGWTSSALNTRTYTMNFGTLTAPTLTPGTGTYASGATVTLSAAPGAAIRYTLNGTTPTTSSPLYVAPLPIDTSLTLKALATHPDYVTSPIASATYTIVVEDPVFSPTGGTQTAWTPITVTTATPGATVHYTVNGVDPTESDPTITSGATVIAGTYILKARAWKAGATTSAVTSAAFTVTDATTSALLAAGSHHSLARRADGVVFAWGKNSYGQLGDRTTTRRTLPTLVAGLTGVVALAGGQEHSLAVRSDGTVWAWGSNGYGRLGDGTTTARHLPTVVIGGLTNVTQVAAGEAHSLARRADGTVWAWGANTSGQLGDGTTTLRTAPVQVPGLTDIVTVAAGASFSVALRADGTVWAWGANGSGQLGDGTTTTRTSPVQVTTLTTATRIAAGAGFALARLSDGSVWSWGLNSYGQLGDGTTTDRTTPAVVPGLTDVTDVAAGEQHALTRTTGGRVYAWGLNNSGQVGDGTGLTRYGPVLLAIPLDVTQVAAGATHSLALTASGVVWTWGRNHEGQIGDGTQVDALTPVAISGESLLWKVATPTFNLATGVYPASQDVVVSVSDADATIHVTTTGSDPLESDPTVANGGSVPITVTTTLKARAYKSGAPPSNVVAATYTLQVVAPTIAPGAGSFSTPPTVTLSTTTPDATMHYTTDGSEPTSSSLVYATPFAIAEPRTVKAIAVKTRWTTSATSYATYFVSLGTAATPTIGTTGGSPGPVFIVLDSATPDATIRYTLDATDPTPASAVYRYPVSVPGATVIRARAFAPGYTMSAVGSATLGADAAGTAPTPWIARPSAASATQQTLTITGAVGTTLRYTTDGTVPSESSSSIASGGTLTVDRAQVVQVRAWQAGLLPSATRRTDVVVTGALVTAGSHTMALTAAGDVYGWGRHNEGQVGPGATVPSQTTPLLVFAGATAVAAGERHSVVLKADRTVWAWGQNGNGQLGDGSTTTRQAAVQVVGVSDVVAVAAGRFHTLAITADGALWAWGRNTSGQLGDGTTTDRPVPTRVLGITGATAVAAGDDFSVVVTSDGAAQGHVWAWGANARGQLGDGTTTPKTSPVAVADLTDVTRLTAGTASVLALDAAGSVWSWGANDEAQLGVGDIVDRVTPTAVAGLRGVVDLAIGRSHAMAVDVRGRAWGWGEPVSGSLGTDATACTYRCTTPLPMLSVGDAIGVVAGVDVSFVRRPDGSVVASGTNLSAQLGLGTIVSPGTFTTIPSLSLASNAWFAADADADGVPTWREYALGLDPL
ncbi:MAG: chitobiase/beta-hexosaminidase C-terminal domain-containing protein, partial [Acidobacteria bacterium]|nr:chitobiase/beta-hexosaminidase C-terminal domain-containing protein [Acidobacteriota bacterium]